MDLRDLIPRRIPPIPFRLTRQEKQALLLLAVLLALGITGLFIF